jgi:hypothetical protein
MVYYEYDISACSTARQSLPATARQQSTFGAMAGMNKESSTIE